LIMEIKGSIPSLTELDPRVIPFQRKLVWTIKRGLDYSQGTHEILCSGAVGSSKSVVAAHLGITHCLENPKALLLIGRRSMPDLKSTLLQTILEHLGDDVPYDLNKATSIITFANGSKIRPYSWADGRYKKVRSLEPSAAIIEELTENEDLDFYHEIKLRVGRLKHVNEKWILSLTNPDDPTHPAHGYFIDKPSEKTHVFYSKTRDNVFLPPSYIATLEEDLDPKMARRMLEGEWLAISQEVVYYSYSRTHNFRDRKYEINPKYPIHITFDFNIGVGKPLSATLFQWIDREFHFFDEVVVEGARTEDVLDEIHGRGYFDIEVEFQVHGDATGKHRDTRSKHSDWEIIKNYLNNLKNKAGNYVRFVIGVPLSNPKVRDRHNRVNAQLHNSVGRRRVFVYGPCKTLDEGFRLTKLKENAGYVEDDSKYYQHVTTAAGYGICWVLSEEGRVEISMLR